jgi:hypothetical protein
LTHANDDKETPAELAAAFPTFDILEKILTLAVEHQIPIPVTQIILDKVKTELSLLKLLEQIPGLDDILKRNIVELSKQAQDVASGYALNEVALHAEERRIVDDDQLIMRNIRQNLRHGGLC